MDATTVFFSSIELVLYYAIYYVFDSIVYFHRLKRIYPSILFFLLYVGFLMVVPEKSAGQVLMQWTCIFCAYVCTFEGKLLEKLRDVSVAFGIITIPLTFVSFLFRSTRVLATFDTTHSTSLLSKIVFFAVLCLLSWGIKLRGKRDTTLFEQRLMNFSVYFILVFSVIAYAALTLLDYLNDLYMKRRSVVFFVGLSYFSVAMLLILSVFYQRIGKRLREQNQVVKEISSMEYEYYEAVKKRNEETRGYRHDMINHLLCVNALAEDERFFEVSEYIKDLLEELKDIREMVYETGNSTVDILTNFYFSNLPDVVQRTISGRWDVCIPPSKLCSIYSNLLKNAVEELQNATEKAYISVRLQQSDKVAVMIIENSKAGYKVTKEGTEHGYGISNVKKALAGIGGVLEIYDNRDSFVAKVVIPL